MFKALEDMNMMNTSMDDMDMPDEGLFDSCMAIHEDHPALAECDEMSNTCDDLEHLHDVISTHGVSKSMMMFANKDGILSAAMPAFAACEALEDDAVAGSPEAEHAKTSVLEKIKSMSAAWFKKAWDMVSGWGGKIADLAKAAYAKVELAAKYFAGKAYDATKAVKEVIVAHPFAVVAGSIAVATAVTGVVVGIWSGELPTDAESYKKWTSESSAKVAEAFRGAGHSISEGVNDGFGKVADAAYSAYTATKSGTAAALDYTKENLEKLLNSAKGLYAEGGPISKLGHFLTTNVVRIFDAVKSHVGTGFSYIRRAITWLMKETWHLWSKAPATTLRLLNSAFATFKGLFTKTAATA